MVTEFPPTLQWLAIAEPTLPPQCFKVFSTVFLGAVSQKCPHNSHLAACIQ